jgi:hypothetical protein
MALGTRKFLEEPGQNGAPGLPPLADKAKDMRRDGHDHVCGSQLSSCGNRGRGANPIGPFTPETIRQPVQPGDHAQHSSKSFFIFLALPGLVWASGVPSIQEEN